MICNRRRRYLLGVELQDIAEGGKARVREAVQMYAGDPVSTAEVTSAIVVETSRRLIELAQGQVPAKTQRRRDRMRACQERVRSDSALASQATPW